MAPLLLNIAAALAYAGGAVFMKASAGYSHVWPTLGVYAAFIAGATFQTLAMHRQEISVSYTFVLGIEAIAAFALGAFFFREPVTPARLAAVLLVASGVYLLRR